MNIRPVLRELSGVEQKQEYADAATSMVRYPEAFAAGTCVFRKKPNARRFDYAMKLENGAVLVGHVLFSQLSYGQRIEDTLRSIFMLNKPEREVPRD